MLVVLDVVGMTPKLELDDASAPDFARGVEIHRKPGYDPAELFFDPADSLVKASAGLNLARKKVGLRHAMRSTPLNGWRCGPRV